ncbi:hypothetical protein CA13_10170 [Planctomycetes bacterium CA13]|uniref:Uncharacterized protein n=1 Tax=Novipirellula herctigrandis TaxID=2527986 RepID=A0A5C5YYQ3_9BACT|nr:hypothetical protein CA13_10170 [Planctomycetes bacterium CA13]
MPEVNLLNSLPFGKGYPACFRLQTSHANVFRCQWINNEDGEDLLHSVIYSLRLTDAAGIDLVRIDLIGVHLLAAWRVRRRRWIRYWVGGVRRNRCRDLQPELMAVLNIHTCHTLRERGCELDWMSLQLACAVLCHRVCGHAHVGKTCVFLDGDHLHFRPIHEGQFVIHSPPGNLTPVALWIS